MRRIYLASFLEYLHYNCRAAEGYKKSLKDRYIEAVLKKEGDQENYNGYCQECLKESPPEYRAAQPQEIFQRKLKADRKHQKDDTDLSKQLDISDIFD